MAVYIDELFLEKSITEISAGSTINVNSVEEKRPPITVRASGDHNVEPASLSAAMGSKASSVVDEVMIIGRNRFSPLVMMARHFPTPLSLKRLI